MFFGTKNCFQLPGDSRNTLSMVNQCHLLSGRVRCQVDAECVREGRGVYVPMLCPGFCLLHNSNSNSQGQRGLQKEAK